MTIDRLPAMGAAARAGNAEARAALDSMARFLDNPSSTSAPPCACCRHLLDRGRFGLAIVTPAHDAPKQAIVFPVCTSCAPDGDALQKRSREVLGELCPDGRVVITTHIVGGRA